VHLEDLQMQYRHLSGDDSQTGIAVTIEWIREGSFLLTGH